MKEIKISIITVSYNSRETIIDTLKSVLKQNYRPLEYIIIDGKSSDGTCEVIEGYIGLLKEHRINMALKQNGVNSSIVVLEKKHMDSPVIDVLNNKIELVLFKILRKIDSFRIKRMKLTSYIYIYKFTGS